MSEIKKFTLDYHDFSCCNHHHPERSTVFAYGTGLPSFGKSLLYHARKRGVLPSRERTGRLHIHAQTNSFGQVEISFIRTSGFTEVVARFTEEPVIEL